MLSRVTRARAWIATGAYVALFAAISVFAAEFHYRYVFVALTLAAGVALVLLFRVGLSARQVIVGALALRAVVFWLPPSLSDDAYRYVWDGHLQQEGRNPFQYRPSDDALFEYRSEEVYNLLNSRDYYSVYPPTSQMVFRIAAVFGPDAWQPAYYVIKLILLVMEIGAIVILLRTVSAAAVLLYAWHPLAVLEIAGQGHTEAAAVLGLVAAVVANRHQRPGWGALGLVTAGLAKLYPLLLLPLFLRRHAWRATVIAGAAIVLFAAPYAAPYVPGHFLESLDLYVRYFEFNAGPYYAVKQFLATITGYDLSKFIGPGFRWLFVVTWLGVLVADIRSKLRLETAFLFLLSAFFVLSTTVHPWYLLPLLAVLPLTGRTAWHWQWLAMLSIGTYVLYVDGPYWLFVNLAWTGWLLLLLWERRDEVLAGIQRSRAFRKYRAIREWVPRDSGRVLDLGAGEGYVGEVIARLTGAEVHLADVLDLNRTVLPFTLLERPQLPYPDRWFDTSLLMFVLHHAEDQRRLLLEALRVSGRAVVVAESVYGGNVHRRLLVFLDRLANRIRSGGAMSVQEEHLLFRTATGWEDFFEELGIRVTGTVRRGRLIHRQVYFRIDAHVD